MGCCLAGPLIIVMPCFQLDPQALQDRDWQRTVIAMNGVCTHRAVTPEGAHLPQKVRVALVPSGTVGRRLSLG